MVGLHIGHDGKRPAGPREGGPGSVESYLRPLRALETMYRAFDEAEKELTGTLGVPICIPNCGRCCATTTVMVWDVEAHFIVSSLMGEPNQIPKVLPICEGWLTEKHPELKTYGLTGTLTAEQWESLMPEVNTLLLSHPCPMLTWDKGCLVYLSRPLACRAYGVTRMPSKICPRPVSRIEDRDTRAHIGPFTPTGNRLRKMVATVAKEALPVDWMGCRFLATSLYMLMQPARFDELAASGQIPSAKLVRLRYSPSILFQDQLNEVWASEIPTSVIPPTQTPISMTSPVPKVELGGN